MKTGKKNNEWEEIELIIDSIKNDELNSTVDYSYFVSRAKDRTFYIKLKDGKTSSVIEVRELDGERLIYDNRYSVDYVWRDSNSELIEITKEEFASIYNQQTDIEEYIARKVKDNKTFYISITAEDGMEIFEFQGKTYKRSVGTGLDEGIKEGNYDDVNLDLVVSLAKRRGGASNIISQSYFNKWWEKRKKSKVTLF